MKTRFYWYGVQANGAERVSNGWDIGTNSPQSVLCHKCVVRDEESKLVVASFEGDHAADYAARHALMMNEHHEKEVAEYMQKLGANEMMWNLLSRMDERLTTLEKAAKS